MSDRQLFWSMVLGAGAVLILGACASSLPTAPSQITNGVAIYEHADYAGESALITEDIKDLKGVKGPCRKPASDGDGDVDIGWSDCISSIRVAPGWRATLYRDDGFKGEQLELTSDAHNLSEMPGGCSKGGFNDCATAIRVFRP
jgi:hypothetical protein